MNNFDLKKFLIENKLTTSSQKIFKEQISRIQSMMGIISEDINFDEITFFKTSQGSKYIRMPDGRLRRWKSNHSNTGGEDMGLHGWSSMSVFVDPKYDKEANAPQFLIGKGYKIGLSKTNDGKIVSCSAIKLKGRYVVSLSFKVALQTPDLIEF